MVTIWVERLRISQRVAAKIEKEHGIDPGEARQAVEQVEGLDFTWDFDARGVRALVYIQIREGNALLVLYPADDPNDHVWKLGNAYFIHG